MYTVQNQEYIKVLVADDDEHVLDCYREVFGEDEQTNQVLALDALTVELFGAAEDIEDQPKFDFVACNQGDDAINVAEAAQEEGKPFDVVILDVRMPPGIDGVEAGCKIRQLDPAVEIVFVTGFSDLSFADLQWRVPPPANLHYFNKPLSFAKLADDVVMMVHTQ